MTITQSRVLPLEDLEILSRAKGGDGRTVVAYAAVFNSRTRIADRDGQYLEQVAPAAFNRTLASGRKIGVFYNHAKTLHGVSSEQASVPIGHPEEIKPDGRGLLTTTRYNTTPLADTVLDAIRNGDITGQSFTGGFVRSSPHNGPYMRDRSGALPLVTRQDIDLLEYGPTPIPAYADAEIMGLRYADQLAAPAEQCDGTCPECRRERLIELGAPGYEQILADRIRAAERWGGPVLRVQVHPDPYDDGRCNECKRPGLVVAPGRSFLLCGECLEIDQQLRTAAEISAVPAGMRAEKVLDMYDEVGWTGGGYRKRY